MRVGALARGQTELKQRGSGRVIVIDQRDEPRFGRLGRGEGGPFVASGAIAPGGALPLNTNGGGLSYMHSGMYGMYALQESVRQMRGLAPAQVPGAKISVCHGVGGMFAASGTIIFSNETP